MVHIINTRADLDAIVGTPHHKQFMGYLRNSIFRSEFDELTDSWKIVEDESTIRRFGFTIGDFQINLDGEVI